MFSNELCVGMMAQNSSFKWNNLDNLMVSIELLNNEVIPYCFIVNETERYLNVVRTSLTDGREKVVILNKEAITRIDVICDDDIDLSDEEKEKVSDCMFT